jgi:4-hydroxybenzoate polyprenyltransferase
MLGRVLLRIGDFVFVLRPLILIPVWSFFILGVRTGRGEAGAGGATTATAAFACLTAIMVTAYLINQVFDQESDRYNDKGHYLTRGIFGVRTVVLLALVFFAIASTTFQRTAAAQRLPLVAALVLSLAYSLPPIRLCARPILDLVANAAGYGGIAYLIGHLAFDPSLARAVLHAAPYAFLVGATFLHTTILDADGDRASGKITSSVLMGTSASALVALVLDAAGLALAVFLGVTGRAGLLPAAILAVNLPAFAVAYARLGNTRDAVRDRAMRARVSSNTVQFATAVVTLPATAAEPRYLALVVILVVAARFYYRARFGVDYPGDPVTSES